MAAEDSTLLDTIYGNISYVHEHVIQPLFHSIDYIMGGRYYSNCREADIDITAQTFVLNSIQLAANTLSTNYDIALQCNAKFTEYMKLRGFTPDRHIQYPKTTTISINVPAYDLQYQMQYPQPSKSVHEKTLKCAANFPSGVKYVNDCLLAIRFDKSDMSEYDMSETSQILSNIITFTKIAARDVHNEIKHLINCIGYCQDNIKYMKEHPSQYPSGIEPTPPQRMVPIRIPSVVPTVASAARTWASIVKT
jgi:hypothetical protein